MAVQMLESLEMYVLDVRGDFLARGSESQKFIDISKNTWQ